MERELSSSITGVSAGDTVNVEAYVGFVTPLVAIVVFLILFIYAEAGTPLHTYISVFMTYFSAFSLLLLVPIDIGSVVVNRRSTTDGNDDDTYNSDIDSLRPQYTTYYVIMTVLCNSVLLFQEYYNTDGYFTTWTRVKSVFRRSAYDYGLYALIPVIVLGVLVGKGYFSDSNALLLAVVLVSNTFNLLILMFILGFGLIAFPLDLWQRGGLESNLKKIQNEAASQFKEMNDMILDQGESIADLRKTKTEIEKQRGLEGTALLALANEMLEGCPNEFRSQTRGTVAIDKKLGRVTLDSLAQLNTRLIEHKQKYRAAQAKIDGTKLSAYRAEDIINAKNKGEGTYQIEWSIGGKKSSNFEYHWLTKYRPVFLRVSAVCLGLMSIFSFLGVVGSINGVPENVSIYFTATHSDDPSGPAVAVFVMMTLAYAAFITSWGLFQMRFSGIMEMQPYRTTSASLSFNARMIARLSPPLAFFYLGWLYENGSRTGDWLDNQADPPVLMQNAFVQFYQVQVIPGMGDFTLTFPCILFGVSFLILTQTLNRFLIFIGLPTYQFGNEVVTEEQLREGRRQLDRHKKQMERTARRYSFRALLKGENETDSDGQQKDVDVGYCRAMYLYLFRKWHQNSEETQGLNSSLTASGRNNRQSAKPSIRIPKSMSGYIEKKGAKWSDKWVKCYFQTGQRGEVLYWKTEKDSEKSEEPIGMIVLRAVSDFKLRPERKLEGPLVRLDLEMKNASDNLKLKFISEELAASWMASMKGWKDFAIDHGANIDNILSLLTTNQNHQQQSIGDDLDAIRVSDSSLDEGRPSDASTGEPSALEGWLERKVPGKDLMSYQRRYCLVNASTGTFEVLEGKPSEGRSPITIASLDLRLVSDIEPLLDTKSGRADSAKFRLDTGNAVEEFKVPPIEASKEWIESLNRWREYILYHHV